MVEARVAVRMYSQVTRTDLHHIVLVMKGIIIFDFVPFAIHFEAIFHILEFESRYSMLIRTPPLQATEKEGDRESHNLSSGRREEVDGAGRRQY